MGIHKVGLFIRSHSVSSPFDSFRAPRPADVTNSKHTKRFWRAQFPKRSNRQFSTELSHKSRIFYNLRRPSSWRTPPVSVWNQFGLRKGPAVPPIKSAQKRHVDHKGRIAAHQGCEYYWQVLQSNLPGLFLGLQYCLLVLLCSWILISHGHTLIEVMKCC